VAVRRNVAVVAGQVWVGGYGPRLVHLDPDTLQPAGTSPVAQEVGPGAAVWPGSAVVWVRNGGDEGLTCMNPADGAALQRWREVQGPVASTTGAALASQRAGAVWLTLDPVCAG
jgi:hypothetical protein